MERQSEEDLLLKAVKCTEPPAVGLGILFRESQFRRFENGHPELPERPPESSKPSFVICPAQSGIGFLACDSTARAEQLSPTVPQSRSKLRPRRANRLHPEKWHRLVSLLVPHIFSETLALGIQAL
jgi:hypothetical protein